MLINIHLHEHLPYYCNPGGNGDYITSNDIIVTYNAKVYYSYWWGLQLLKGGLFTEGI